MINPTKDELVDRFKSKTDIELLDILSRPDDFKEEAVEAARSILHTRNIEPEKVQSFVKAKQEEDERLNDVSREELTLMEKILYYFIFMIPLLRPEERKLWINEGKTLKVQQSRIFGAFGFLSLIGNIVIAVLDNTELDFRFVFFHVFFFLTIYTIDIRLRRLVN